MRILDAEIKLRDATREAEQLRMGKGPLTRSNRVAANEDRSETENATTENAATDEPPSSADVEAFGSREESSAEDRDRLKLDPAEIAVAYAERAEALASEQETLAKRTLKVVKSIEELPEGPGAFQKEIRLLMRVGEVMVEATEILSEPDTGNRAVAAETEAIELLLQTKRTMGGGGGGGSNPGGGGGGTTSASALALIGSGVNPQGKIGARSVDQQAGKAGRELPAEFRKGLDRFLSLPVTGGSTP